MNLLRLERLQTRTLAYQLGYTLFAAWLIWPIYQDTYLAVVVGLAAILGVVGARILSARAGGWLNKFLYGLAGVVIIGPLVSAPYIFTSGANLFRNWLDAITAIVFGWKQLVTIDPPIGTYHGLMVPAFVVFFVANLVGATIAFGSQKRNWLGILPFFGMIFFAFAFGQQDVPAQTSLFGLVLDINSAYISALIILMVSIRYLNPPTGKRTKFGFANLRGVRAILRQGFQFGGSWVVVLAAFMAFVLVLGSSVGSSRDVLRAAKPTVFQGEDISPLSLYRQSFTDTTKLGQEILRYENATDRIRVAVMTDFDGQVFRVDKDEQGNPLSFSLLPAALVSNNGDQKTTETKFQLLNRNSVWLPVVNNLAKVDFEGVNAQDFGDHFYYNRDTNSGALLGVGVPAGDLSYKVTSYVDDQVDPTTITANPNTLCADSTNADSVVPSSLCEWMDLQDEDLSTASGFEQLIQKLRARGYLSHSLDEPKGEGTWVKQLSGYTFYSSRAGHSTGRIAQMFKDLVALQQSYPAGAKNSQLVATAGDDEQFATAAALLARAAGFDSRVVLGFRTAETTANLGVTPCANNVCRGQNLTAWVEISSAGSKWLPIDVTPQFKDKMKTTPEITGLIQNQAEPGQDNATVLPPAQVDPTENQKQKECAGGWLVCDGGWNLIWGIVWGVVFTALGATIIIGPFAVIILGKRRRRRLRQNAATLAKRITNAWDEYVDNLVDLGENGLRRLPANETRPELIRKAAKANEELLQSSFAKAMVTYTDFAAFAPEQPNPDYERDVWAFVDSEFAKATAEMSRLRKLKVLLSLRSFLYRASESEPNTVNTRRIGPEGSSFAAFIAVAKHGSVEAWEWFKPRAKTFIETKILRKVGAKSE